MLDELREAVKRYTDTAQGESPFVTAVSGLTILRSDHERRPQPLIHKPAICAAVQGAKREIFGDRRLEYRAGRALIVSVETPAVATIVEASPGEPFLGFVIEFDLAILRDVLNELATPPGVGNHTRHGVFVTDFSGPLADCVLRMVRLLNTPLAIPILYPGIMREICYWILTGPHGEQVVRMTMANTHEQNVIRAIHSLRHRFAKAIRIKELAAIAKMSETAFPRYFKIMTSMTPLQYQKQLRLIEARRLMLAESMNVESAAFQVGYESPSQFSREYTRMFGASPRRDIAAMQLVAA